MMVWVVEVRALVEKLKVFSTQKREKLWAEDLLEAKKKQRPQVSN